jgi:hypothetical protein
MLLLLLLPLSFTITTMFDNLGKYKQPDLAPYKLTIAALINTPDFNPFIALGLDLATIIAAIICLAYIYAMRYYYKATIARFLAITINFPLQV